MSVQQDQLLDLGPRKSISKRFEDRIVVTPRCCNCGTEVSFTWRKWDGRSVCGDCWGLTFDEVWGKR
jgi:hypothetical protein